MTTSMIKVSIRVVTNTMPFSLRNAFMVSLLLVHKQVLWSDNDPIDLPAIVLPAGRVDVIRIGLRSAILAAVIFGRRDPHLYGRSTDIAGVYRPVLCQ